MIPSFFLSFGYFLTKRLFLLVQQNRYDIFRMLLGQQFLNAIDGNTRFTEEANDTHPLQIILGVQSATHLLRQFTWYKNVSGIVVLLHRLTDTPQSLAISPVVYFDIAFTSLHCLFYIITQRHKQYLTQGDFFHNT